MEIRVDTVKIQAQIMAGVGEDEPPQFACMCTYIYTVYIYTNTLILPAGLMRWNG